MQCVAMVMAHWAANWLVTANDWLLWMSCWAQLHSLSLLLHDPVLQLGCCVAGFLLRHANVCSVGKTSGAWQAAQLGDHQLMPALPLQLQKCLSSRLQAHTMHLSNIFEYRAP